MPARKATALAPRLMQWRTKREFTQADLEARSGVSRATIQRAERGGVISPLNLAKLANALEVTTADIGEIQPAMRKSA